MSLFSKNGGVKTSGLWRKYPTAFHSKRASFCFCFVLGVLFFFFFKKRGKAVSLNAKNSSGFVFSLVFVFSTDVSKCCFSCG